MDYDTAWARFEAFVGSPGTGGDALPVGGSLCLRLLGPFVC